jgi:hypothetical protein
MRRKRKKNKTIPIETLLLQRRQTHIDPLGAELEQRIVVQIIHRRMKTWKAAAAAAAAAAAYPASALAEKTKSKMKGRARQATATVSATRKLNRRKVWNRRC